MSRPVDAAPPRTARTATLSGTTLGGAFPTAHLHACGQSRQPPVARGAGDGAPTLFHPNPFRLLSCGMPSLAPAALSRTSPIGALSECRKAVSATRGKDDGLLKLTSVSLEKPVLLHGVRAHPTGPVNRESLVASTRSTSTCQNSETAIHNVLEEQWVELSKRARCIRSFRENGNRKPNPIRESTVVSSLLNESRGKFELHFDRY